MISDQALIYVRSALKSEENKYILMDLIVLCKEEIPLLINPCIAILSFLTKETLNSDCIMFECSV